MSDTQEKDTSEQGAVATAPDENENKAKTLPNDIQRKAESLPDDLSVHGNRWAVKNDHYRLWCEQPHTPRNGYMRSR